MISVINKNSIHCEKETVGGSGGLTGTFYTYMQYIHSQLQPWLTSGKWDDLERQNEELPTSSYFRWITVASVWPFSG